SQCLLQLNQLLVADLPAFANCFDGGMSVHKCQNFPLNTLAVLLYKDSLAPFVERDVASALDEIGQVQGNKRAGLIALESHLRSKRIDYSAQRCWRCLSQAG